MPRALLVTACLAATTALAQPVGPDTRLLLPGGILTGSPRAMGLAGALTGIADDTESITRNPAAVVSKDPHFPSEPNLGFGFALHFIPPFGASGQDWDNDGLTDRHPAPLSFISTQVGYVVASLQYRSFGLAAGLDVQNYMFRSATGGFNLGLARLFAVAAFATPDDDLLLGAGMESTQVVLSYLANRQFQESLYYGGLGPTFGALWRPRDQDFRVGFTALLQSEGRSPGARPRNPLGGLTPFGSVVSPTTLTLGASWAPGSGRHYNITRPEDWAAFPGGTRPSPVLTRWLLTAQLDVALPVTGAIAEAGFFDQAVADPLPAGNRATFTPRLGAEKEVLPEHLRLRVGSFLEPALVATGRLRPHVTFGGEVYLFRLPLVQWPIGFGLAFDFARTYENLSFGFFIWR